MLYHSIAIWADMLISSSLNYHMQMNIPANMSLQQFYWPINENITKCDTLT